MLVCLCVRVFGGSDRIGLEIGFPWAGLNDINECVDHFHAVRTWCDFLKWAATNCNKLQQTATTNQMEASSLNSLNCNQCVCHFGKYPLRGNSFHSIYLRLTFPIFRRSCTPQDRPGASRRPASALTASKFWILWPATSDFLRFSRTWWMHFLFPSTRFVFWLIYFCFLVFRVVYTRHTLNLAIIDFHDSAWKLMNVIKEKCLDNYRRENLILKIQQKKTT